MTPDNATIGECYDPAMKITDQKEADEYLKMLIERNMRVSGQDRATAEKIEKGNLGYYAGYYSDETRARVEHLFKCSHPVFGKIEEVGAPTSEQAFNAGVALASAYNLSQP